METENAPENEEAPVPVPEATFTSIFKNLLSAKLANIIFIVLSVVLVLGVVSNFWFSNQFDLLSQPIISKDKPEYVEDGDSADWQTYMNYEHGFSIDYPDGWVYEVSPEEEGTHIKVVFSNSRDFGSNHVDITLYDREHGLDLKENAYLSETNLFTIKGSDIYGFKLVFENEEALTQEFRQVYLETFREMLGTFEVFVTEPTAVCKPTGCSGQICSDEEIVTTCEYSEVFACYKDEICERQTNGKCGWTMSDTLKECLKEAAGVMGADDVKMVPMPQ